MSAPKRTYAEQEHAALEALAMRTIADPSSSPEDVEAAEARLLSGPVPTSDQLRAAYSYEQRRAMLAILEGRKPD